MLKNFALCFWNPNRFKHGSSFHDSAPPISETRPSIKSNLSSSDLEVFFRFLLYPPNPPILNCHFVLSHPETPEG